MDKNIDFSSKFKSANILSLLIFTMSVLFILFKGLNYGIDFKGGTLIELRTDSKNVNISEIRSSLNSMNLGDVNVKEFGKEGDYLIKVEQKTENNNQLIPEIKKTLINKLNAEINFRRVENVGPKVSSELLQSGIIAISLSLVAMLFYIWIRFEWQFSIGAVAALIHDIIITIGIFSFLKIEFNLSIIAALLTIIGYSMNDTVVVYDRIRENLRKYKQMELFDLINKSLNETMSRTLLTSVTTLIALFSLYFLGGEVLKGFTFAMILGVFIGTYSSVFIASQIILYLNVKRDWSKN